MKKNLIIWSIGLISLQGLVAQQTTQENKSIYKISKEFLAGEGLKYIQQKDTSKTVYQEKVYDGKNIAIYMVAIGTGITNKFDSFPLEEFIYWMNGKAIVNPTNEAPFEVQTGDYFVQAKGFEGTWNFVDNGGLHLELSLIAKNRSNSPKKSPISKALIIDRDIISGIENEKKDSKVIYQGAELKVKLIRTKERVFDGKSEECLIHVLNGVVTITDHVSQEKQTFYPGDFFVIPDGYKGSWSSNSLQDLRVIQVSKVMNKQ